MSDTIKLVIEGVDKVDALELREALEDSGATNVQVAEEPHKPLAAGQHGTPDMVQLVLDFAGIAVPVVSTAVALWLTRSNKKTKGQGVVFVAEGDNVTYARFDASEVSQSSDPKQIAAALTQRFSSNKDKSSGKAG